VGGEAAPGRSPVQSVAHHIDQGAGLLGLGRAGLGDVQAEQDRQAELAGQERHGHHDPDDHEAVAAPDSVASLGGAVVLVLRAVHLLAVAPVTGRGPLADRPR
jgi:hypothetical protein